MRVWTQSERFPDVQSCLTEVGFPPVKECVSSQEVQRSLRHVHKLLSTQETAFLHSVRSLRKKLNLLYNNTLKNSSNCSSETSICPPPNPPANGRMLGQVFKVGHEVHFLCNHGFQLSGPETRECLDSLSWSGEEPACKIVDAETHTNPTASIPISTSSPTSPAVSAHVHPSHCIESQGSMQCTCDQGYSVSSQDRGLCTDIDECELFRMTKPGRLCLHMCMNTAGSYYCQCPTGYSVKDERSCQDINECKRGTHNCTEDQECVNTYGGHKCILVECPHFHDASYIKTSPLQCERNPCVKRNKACLQAPVSFTFHFQSVLSNLSTPRVLLRVSATRMLGDTLRFGLVENPGAGLFNLQRSARLSAELILVESVQGPATLEVDVEMTELEKKTLLGRYVTRVTIFVSPYSF
ncbi:fibulin-7-like [Silurus asotus]|uniref:Fibulin-7-like n=1 Tax=Silurus asotus TaxID=30991 RepID=A0AAD5B4D2_SILAS|nr:fibulin-7-like [Silurus asotus]